jgi:hypothetical protein
MLIANISIQGSHTSMVCISDHDKRPPCDCPLCSRSQTHLIFPREQGRIVLDEIVLVMHHGVRGIEKYEIPPTGLIKYCLKIADPEPNRFQRQCNFREITDWILNLRLGSHRYVEDALAIHAVETIKTSTIKVNQLDCSFDWIGIEHLPYLVVLAFTVGSVESTEFGVNALTVRPYTTIGVNQFIICVSQECIAGEELEEHSTATKKQFNISVKLGREEVPPLLNEPPFSARPLQEGFRHRRLAGFPQPPTQDSPAPL